MKTGIDFILNIPKESSGEQIYDLIVKHFQLLIEKYGSDIDIEDAYGDALYLVEKNKKW